MSNLQNRIPQNKRQAGAAVRTVMLVVGIFMVLIIVVVALLSSGKKDNNNTATTTTGTSTSTDSGVSSPSEVAKVSNIPANFTTYTDTKHVFSLAYPKAWGSFTDLSGPLSTSVQATVKFSQAIGQYTLVGPFEIAVQSKNQFTLPTDGTAAQYPYVGPTKNANGGYSWKYTTTTGSHKAGDAFSPRTLKSDGNITAYDMSWITLNGLQARWVFDPGDSTFVIVAMPFLTNPNAVTPFDASQYNTLSQAIAKTIAAGKSSSN